MGVVPHCRGAVAIATSHFRRGGGGGGGRGGGVSLAGHAPGSGALARGYGGGSDRHNTSVKFKLSSQVTTQWSMEWVFSRAVFWLSLFISRI